VVTISDIQQFFRGHIAINEPMAKYTSMRVGGPADYYVEPVDKKDLIEIVSYFEKNSYPYMMLGRGSNMIVSDEGIRCAALNVESSLSDVRMEGDLVIAEAGAHW
jgi:UDP-N-acetylmuramate dehydrogenase